MVHHLRQSHIDQSVWSSIVPGSPTPQGVWNPKTDVPAVGWVVVYVDDFLIVGDNPTIEATTEAINNRWKVSEKPTLQYGSNLSVEYLSVDVKATPQGLFLPRPVYTADLLKKWSVQDCKRIGSLGDIEVSSEADEDEEEAEGDSQTLQRARKAQRLAGGLNWFATRTRADICILCCAIELRCNAGS